MHHKSVPCVLVSVVLINMILFNVVNGTCSFKFLGKAGNKVYFFSRTTGTWSSSKTLCENMNMKLASIQTDEENHLVRSSFKAGEFQGWFWAARIKRQFVWENTGGKLVDSLKIISNVTDALTISNDLEACTAFKIEKDWSGMVFFECSRTNGYVLCEV